MTFTYATPVRFADVDHAGIVYYPRFFHASNSMTLSVLGCVRIRAMSHCQTPWRVSKNNCCSRWSDLRKVLMKKGFAIDYYQYIEAEKGYVKKDEEGKSAFDNAVATMKKDGAGKKYDCKLGVSGGVDSTYLAYIASKDGLRVLCVHFDNGWNSELAVTNIESIVSKLAFGLYTYVIDWPEFRDIQLAYFKANVIDIEAVTDLAIFSALDIFVSGTSPSSHCRYDPRSPLGRPNATRTSGAARIFGSPSTGYHSRSMATRLFKSRQAE